MTATIWIGFLVFVVAMVSLDLGVFHKKHKVITIRSALGWSAVWILLALVFNAVIFLLYENNYSWASLATENLDGRQAAGQYLMGYVLEKSLSLDNIFVIAMVFSYFRVPLAMQHRVLFWGILGAVVLRGIMIGTGVALDTAARWVIVWLDTWPSASPVTSAGIRSSSATIPAACAMSTLRVTCRKWASTEARSARSTGSNSTTCTVGWMP